MSDIKIIAQLGDSGSLKSEDMGKRFIRLGASEETPEVIQGTIQTNPIWAKVNAVVVLENVGLTLLNPDDYHPHWMTAMYFITGAIVYEIYDDQLGGTIGILASVREAPSGNHSETYADPDFDRQYPLLGTETDEYEELRERRGDNSVAKELDEILAEYAAERNAA